MLIQLFEISYQYKLNITVILFILTICFYVVNHLDIITSCLLAITSIDL
jgi:hypothetical protein